MENHYRITEGLFRVITVLLIKQDHRIQTRNLCYGITPVGNNSLLMRRKSVPVLALIKS